LDKNITLINATAQNKNIIFAQIFIAFSSKTLYPKSCTSSQNENIFFIIILKLKNN
jgi:hypothetical protein